ncbi:MAG TPA: bifunctional UDP-sugar hydrolase/5'-nucleotidase [Thermoanaerobaculaceae bacterium]|nr:bifunctional UDP-sugar hydrolase/5'-nucleotidase [Thermoanaerobaculaceae bacterium]
MSDSRKARNGFRRQQRTMEARCARFALVVCLALAVSAGVSAARAANITVLHVSDTHSHLDAWGPKDRYLEGTIGGIAKAATVITEVRAHEPNVLLLHAGDAFHGDLFFNAYFGVPEFQLMKRLGFDAMAVGNHEFDLGPDVLAGSLQAAFGNDTLPLLSANLDLSAYPALATWISPSVIKVVGGVRVGIFGLTVPDDVTNQPAPVVILGAGDPAALMAIAGQQVAALRDAGADVVICLSHLGGQYDRALAAGVPGIDVIVGGHDHEAFRVPVTVTDPAGRPTIIVHAGMHYEYVGCLELAVDGGRVAVLGYELLPVDRKVEPLPQVQAVVDDLKQGIVAAYGDMYHLQLATATYDLGTTTNPRQPRRDTAMGDLITDALRAKTGTDVAITANGLIDEGIFRGPIVGADLFRPIGYGYDPATGLGLRIATFDITGAELSKALEFGLAYLGINDDFFLQVSGMRFSYDAQAPAGQRVVPGSVRIRGRRLDPNAKYSVTVNEAVAMLLPLLDVQVEDLQLLPDLEFNVLKEFVVALHRVSYRPEERIVEVGGRRWGRR